LKQLFPNFIKAESVEGLRSLMASISLKSGGTVNFFSVYYDSKERSHVAWYHDTIENITAQVSKGIKDKSNEGQS
jgi:hypothetical protein